MSTTEPVRTPSLTVVDRRDEAARARVPGPVTGNNDRIAANAFLQVRSLVGPAAAAVSNEDSRGRIVPLGVFRPDPTAEVVDGRARVTPEVAGEIIRNLAENRPAFKPEVGLGGASWFLTEGAPHAGIDRAKNVSVPVDIRPPASRLTFGEAELTSIFNGIRDGYDMNAMEGKYRAYKTQQGTPLPAGPLNARARQGFERYLSQVTEKKMWEEVGHRVSQSPTRVGEVVLENSRFSRQGNGKFLVVSDASRVSVRGGVNAVMDGLTQAGHAAEPGVLEAAQRTASQLKWAGRVRGAFRVGGRVLLVVGAAADAYHIYTARDKVRASVEVAGGWAGAAGAVAAFSAWYTPADVAGPWAWAGHGVGALGAGALGYFLGSSATTAVYDLAVDP